jgi:predicted adenylyl cyclase CyaB
MKNFEIKARVGNHKILPKTLQKLGARFIENLHQIDTYFEVPKGRLKLREEGKKGAYLIYYERGEKNRERWSRYYMHPVQDTKTFKEVFDACLGKKVIVDKKRALYMYQNARIHIDAVKGLGNFMEIEVLVKKGETQAKGLMAELLAHLQVPKKDFIKKSYSDLLLVN